MLKMMMLKDSPLISERKNNDNPIFRLVLAISWVLLLFSSVGITQGGQKAAGQALTENVAENNSSAFVAGQNNNALHSTSTEDVNSTAHASMATTDTGIQVWNITEYEAKEITDNAAQAYEEITDNNNSAKAIVHLENIIALATGGSNNTSKIIAEIMANDNDTDTAATNNNNNNNNTATSPSTTDTEQRAQTFTAPQPSSYLQQKKDTITTGEIIPAQQLQEQQLLNQTILQQATDNGTRQFRITFEKLHVNVDHDPIFEGEWIMDSYVNRQRVPLFSGPISVADGETVDLSRNNSIVVAVPEESGHIWIVSAGWENDVGFEEAPSLEPIFRTQGGDGEIEQEQRLAEEGIVEEEDLKVLDAGQVGIGDVNYENEVADEIDRATAKPNLTFEEYVNVVQETIAYHTGSANDAQGYVQKQFTASDNFGVGEHRICSEPNQFADEGGANTVNTRACDFELEYRVEEIE
jgi:hypothetical protein